MCMWEGGGARVRRSMSCMPLTRLEQRAHNRVQRLQAPPKVPIYPPSHIRMHICIYIHIHIHIFIHIHKGRAGCSCARAKPLSPPNTQNTHMCTMVGLSVGAEVVAERMGQAIRAHALIALCVDARARNTFPHECAQPPCNPCFTGRGASEADWSRLSGKVCVCVHAYVCVCVCVAFTIGG